jgi:hypothetical protein
MFLISFKFPARSEPVDHCFISWTLYRTSYQSYCPNISCNMAGLAETWSSIEVHSVIWFLQLKGTSLAEILHQLVEVGCCEEVSYCCMITRGHTHSQPHAWVVTALQLGGTGPSSLQPWPDTEWFSSLWTTEEAPGWKAIHNRRWSSASRHVLASGTWHWFLLCWDRCLGVPLGQMLKQVGGLRGKIIKFHYSCIYYFNKFTQWEDLLPYLLNHPRICRMKFCNKYSLLQT